MSSKFLIIPPSRNVYVWNVVLQRKTSKSWVSDTALYVPLQYTGLVRPQVKFKQFHYVLTQEIIWRESFKVPHLKHQLSRYFPLCLFQGKYVFSFTNHHLFLCWEVVEWEHKAPVEVALSCQGVVMYVCLLLVLFQALYPPMASTAVTRGAWTVVIIVWLQAWLFTNSYLVSRRQHTIQDCYTQQQPVGHLLLAKMFVFLGTGKTASVIYSLVITLYSCCATLLNSVTMFQNWFQCSVLESKLSAVPVWGYKHGISMVGKVSGFPCDFLLISATVWTTPDVQCYGTKGQCFPQHNLLFWRAPLRLWSS